MPTLEKIEKRASRLRRATALMLAPALACSLSACRGETPSTASAPPAQPAITIDPAAPPAQPTVAIDPAAPAAKPTVATDPPADLNEHSTLTQWSAATPAARSHLAVEIARKRLPAGTDKLELAKTAMEITGCLSATARDPRFASWTVAPTAITCLTAEER